MSTHEIMVPKADQLPAHIVDAELAKQANAVAGEGISAGAPPRLKVVGKGSFAFVKGGEEIPVKHNEMVEGADGNLYLKAVIIAAKGPLSRGYYVKEFDPNSDEVSAPDCFSNDGLKPDNSVAAPICDVCANCPMAAFGSAKKGEGQACTQTKTLAGFFPKKGAHKVKVTPKALKGWKKYVGELTAAGIPVSNVFTLIGFVEKETFPVLKFAYGGPLSDDPVKQSKIVGQLTELTHSPEVLEIIEDRVTASAPKQIAQEVKQEAKQEPVVEKVVEPEVVKEEEDMFAAAPETAKTVEVESTNTTGVASQEVAGAAELSAEEIEKELFG